MKAWIDRPDTTKIKNFEKMVAELSKYMNDFEIDACVDFMESISDSKWDINPSVEDCASQLRIILGSERYMMIKAKWSEANQHLMQNYGENVKYIRLSDGTVWDGLDPTDNPQDYTTVKM
jgi:hypothetical protein